MKRFRSGTGEEFRSGTGEEFRSGTGDEFRSGTKSIVSPLFANPNRLHERRQEKLHKFLSRALIFFLTAFGRTSLGFATCD